MTSEVRYHLNIVVNTGNKELDEDISNYYLEKINDKDRIERGDSGFDVIIPNSLMFVVGTTQLIDLGIKCSMTREIIDDYGNNVIEDSPYYLYPRSSIYKSQLRVANSCGIIDKGYRGNLKIPVDIKFNYKKIISIFIGLISLLGMIGMNVSGTELYTLAMGLVYAILIPMNFVFLMCPGSSDGWDNFTYKINAGDRYVQICTPTLDPITHISIIKDFDDETSRGEGGFGSTGR